jgi:hypothetical protein
VQRGENTTFDLKEIRRNIVDRINLATERDKWHTFVNMP